MTNPAEQLEGLTLEGNWQVGQQILLNPNSTGGNFSCGYFVTSPDGRNGFLKALDFSRALKSPDPARILQALTEAFNYERDLCEKCNDKFFDRIVRSICSGTVNVPNSSYGAVQYLIFELAEGDARTYLAKLAAFDLAWALRTLHHVATGLKQLHGLGIAHQDLKPSNVLVFNRGAVSKVADLGRASSINTRAPHDGLDIAGDPSYAPPEHLYGYVHPEWKIRRLRCDIYLLGSLGVFFFTKASMTSLLLSEIHPAHHYPQWTGTFQEVLPYLGDAYSRVLVKIASVLPIGVRDDLMPVFRSMCEPDPLRRGCSKGRSLTLENYVTKFDLLARRAENGFFV